MLLSIALFLCVAPFLVTGLIVTAEIFAFLIFRQNDVFGETYGNALSMSTVVLMPAHNEAAIIEETLSALKEALPASTSILVVADNCTDDTAEIARAVDGPISVIERNAPGQRGKGFALDFGRRHLREAAPDVVVILDADCQISSTSLRLIIRRAHSLMRPVQSRYVMTAPDNAGPGAQIAEFAMFVKNVARATATQLLGDCCHLMGTGMAFPWRVFDKLPLDKDNIVEDIAMGIAAADMGRAPVLTLNAVVNSDFPSNDKAFETQRTRWEQGHLNMVFNIAPKIIMDGVTSRNLALIVLGIDLMAPPLSFLIMGFLANLCLQLVVLLFYGPTTPFFLTLYVFAAFVGAIVWLWARGGREHLSLKSVLAIPIYMFRKVNIYSRFFARKKDGWVKTDRGQ